ncbi:hypothetical protein [Filifactor villosus]|uniref:VanZ-like domain-containing protein n=1 Tax=Filifactor villosus TaxID=29374 RepID=A0ABV9QJ48_9FIRM
MKNTVSKITVVSSVYVLLLLLAKFFYSSRPVYLVNKQMNGVNLIPSRTIAEYITYFDRYNPSILISGVLSLLIFIPLSVYIFFLLREVLDGNAKLIFAYSLSVSFMYSFLSRLLTVGTFDVDTLILRALLMMCTFWALNRISPKPAYNAVT